MTDSENFIHAFRAAGLVGMLREWDDDGPERLIWRKNRFCHEIKEHDTEDWVCVDWEVRPYIAASIIIRQLTEDCDEAGVDLVRHVRDSIIVRAGARYLGTGGWGPWTDVILFASRPEAMLAACVARKKEA